jgi:hypothetical protein
MLTYEDCVALCPLSEAEIEAIREHEHIPAIIAAELAAYLIRAPDGSRRIRHIIIDDIRNAEARNDLRRVVELKSILRHFIENHPSHPVAG